MSDDLTDLYQEIVIDHSKRPRNFHLMEDADAQAEGYNPFCGDRVTVYLKRSGDTLAAASFQGSGCAICTASASMMTEAVRGQSQDDALRLFDWFHRLLTEDNGAPEPPTSSADSLVALTGVKQFPIRIKCATLAWHALKKAIAERGGVVSTE